MKLLSPLITLASAQLSYQIPTSIEHDIGQFFESANALGAFGSVDFTLIMHHGCHCVRLSDYSLGGGDAKDPLDEKCRSFFHKRNCIKQAGPAGACHNVEYAGESYTAQLVLNDAANHAAGVHFGGDADFHCELETDPCKNAICRVDHQAIFELITYEMGHAGHAYLNNAECNRSPGVQNTIQCVGPVPNVSRFNQFTSLVQTPSKTATVRMSLGADLNATDCNGFIFIKQFEHPKRTEISHDLYDCGAEEEGSHGFHVHITNDFSDGCYSTGGHYNPEGASDTADEVGMLASIIFDGSGNSRGSQIDDRAFLDGDWSIAGRSLVMHSAIDGDRLICGEIVVDDEPDIVGEVTMMARGSTANDGCKGTIRLRQFTSRGETEFWYNLSGCGASENGLHGFHVHVTADFSNECYSTGGHYNPTGTSTLADEVGMLEKIHIDENGNANGVFVDSRAFLDGQYSIDGLSLVMHALDASNRLSCGTVNVVSGRRRR